MAARKQADRIVFQTTKHHKQLLRSQIDPALIDMIEVDKNPSLNYMNAYRSLYTDELTKTVQMQEEKKQKNKEISDYDKYLFAVGMREERPPMIDQTNMSSSQLSKIGKRFVDYDQEGTMKKQDHVVKNYDGGQAFFKSHDQHLQRKKAQSLVTNQTLSNQLQYKEFARMKQQEKKNQQNQAFSQLKYRQRIEDQEKLQNQKYERSVFRQDIVNQIEEEKERRQMKSKFEYQNIARHNPITNPIEYHIDNPYILKEIQNRNIIKSQSVYQMARY